MQTAVVIEKREREHEKRSEDAEKWYTILYYTSPCRPEGGSWAASTEQNRTALNNSTAGVRIPDLWNGNRLTKKEKKKTFFFFLSVTYRTDFQNLLKINLIQQIKLPVQMNSALSFFFIRNFESKFLFLLE